MAKSILQDWVQELGLRHQGVLLAIVRGCDVVQKENITKSLSRAIRGFILNPHCEDLTKAKSFMEFVNNIELQHRIDNFFDAGFDHYPAHFVLHLFHAVEILGYKHPNNEVCEVFNKFYIKACKKMHVNYESEEQLDFRLNLDEISFAKTQ
jgi:hypothetical protein